MPKIHITNPEQFAKDYPHLVRTKIEPDVRKIKSALRDGWKVDGVELVEGADEEADEGAPEKAPGDAEEVPTFIRGAQKPLEAPQSEKKADPEIMLPKAPADPVPKKYDEKMRLPGEENREFHRRMTLLDEAKKLENDAKRKAGIA